MVKWAREMGVEWWHWGPLPGPVIEERRNRELAELTVQSYTGTVTEPSGAQRLIQLGYFPVCAHRMALPLVPWCSMGWVCTGLQTYSRLLLVSQQLFEFNTLNKHIRRHQHALNCCITCIHKKIYLSSTWGWCYFFVSHRMLLLNYL